MTDMHTDGNGHRAAARRAEVLVEALPYIRRFSGHIVVIKLGGAVDAAAADIDSVLQDVVLLRFVGMRPVLVHGRKRVVEVGS